MTTYEEMIRAKEAFKESRLSFVKEYEGFLRTVLQEAGVYNKLVRVKTRGGNTIGQFRIDYDKDSNIHPCIIKFYPLTKKGTISQNSVYVFLHPWDEHTLVDRLMSLVVEVVGDLP